MRGADVMQESLFSFRRLEEFVPAQHPLRGIYARSSMKRWASLMLNLTTGTPPADETPLRPRNGCAP